MASVIFSSAYWLLVAVRISPSEYGVIMQWQALLMFLSAIFALRTHDLVFYLNRSHNFSLKESFQYSFNLELLLALMGFFISGLITYNINLIDIGQVKPPSATIILILAFLANITLLQGACTAYLRISLCDRDIAVVDFIVSIAWIFCLITVAYLPPSGFLMLLIALLASGTRSILIILMAIILLKTNREAEPQEEKKRTPIKVVIKFLLLGQIPNFLKNNMQSIETLLLGRISPAETVAIYRIARSFVSFSSVFINVIYQKAFSALHHAKNKNEIAKIKVQTSKRGIISWLISIPVIFIGTFLFQQIKGSQSYPDLDLVVIFALIASLPIVLQQAEYAILMLNNNFIKISISHIIAIFILVFLMVAFYPNKMSADIYFIFITIAGLGRYLYMRKECVKYR